MEMKIVPLKMEPPRRVLLIPGPDICANSPTPHNKFPILTCSGCGAWTPHGFVGRTHPVHEGVENKTITNLMFACLCCNLERPYGSE